MERNLYKLRIEKWYIIWDFTNFPCRVKLWIVHDKNHRKKIQTPKLDLLSKLETAKTEKNAFSDP